MSFVFHFILFFGVGSLSLTLIHFLLYYFCLQKCKLLGMMVWRYNKTNPTQACFLILHLSVLALIWVFKMNLQLRSYTRQSIWSYSTANLQQSGLSFTLFWTLFYGLVYLY